MKYIILFWVLSLVLSQTTYYSTSTGSNFIDACHCNLIQGFCDFNCCCDSDCTSETINGLKEFKLKCQSNPMLNYCMDKSYFAFVNVQASSVDVQSDGRQCYYFNSINNDQPEITLSQSMVKSIINKQIINTVANNNQTFYTKGYDSTKEIFQINKPIDELGECKPSSGTQKFYFGLDYIITCNGATLTQNQKKNILLYTWLSNTTISQFKDQDNFPNISFPSVSFSNDNNEILSKLTVLIFYGKTGIQATPLNYIIDTRIIQTYSTNPQIFTLEVRFVDYNTMEQTTDNLKLIQAPFFPMIPSDIFYPLTYNYGKYMVTILFGLLIFIF